MSVAPSSLTSSPQPAALVPQRAIGTIIADVTVSEEESHEVEITQHPVDRGAEISDHAFARPATVRLLVGFSANSLGANGVTYPIDMYKALLALQQSLTLFNLVTGKLSYSNMLIKSLAVTTNVETENVAMISVLCQQVLIADTTTTSLPPASSQGMPNKTAAVQPTGTKQPASLSSVPAGVGSSGGLY